MSRTTNSQPVVRCREVTRTYRGAGGGRLFDRFRDGDERPTTTALEDVSLSVTRGEVVGVEGPSGSGKSTLLHLLAALDVPTRGTVSVCGADTAALSGRERTRLRLEDVGIVFQRFHLFPSLSARANVALPLVERGVSKRERREQAERLLDRVGLGDRVTHTPRRLSGGEQQRVAVARALITEPSLLVADEPTGELDTATGDRVLSLFTEAAAEETAVVLASHDRDALDVADRVITLRDGGRING
ncbi:ABC transporter ATP-binding protein [Halorubrum ezzemoulense]|uniref:ABC transporter ATP-binding protein n=1 Tax=Halorubrum ezzemoulense TaxID=337243 RepID=UPI00232C7ABF|nr:ABC transporter ATP-binding protein [Halorubrum ezzemoulense]MDB2262082.1 ABC transporter ATP-binding protein [Halorubrum ezzemoulense]MDB2268929.1 ABC transporter ATP-binding protein [Halorubrum ezzemoulense]